MFSEGAPDMQALLEQAAMMQQQLIAGQEALAEARVEGSSGGGLVTATVSGTGDLVGLVIDGSVCDPDDPETVADLVLAAVRDASTQAAALAEQQMGGLAGGFDVGPPPGGQLGS